jgi:endonuclease/exonuclease/phosphatase family metal-dependent hydrolase
MRDRIYQYMFLGLACIAWSISLGLNNFERGLAIPLEAPAGAVRLMTWNVGGSIGKTGRAMPDKHIAHVVSTLLGTDTDIVILQELANKEQALRMRKKLGASWQLLVSNYGDRRIAILVRDYSLGQEQITLPYGDGLICRIVLSNDEHIALAALHADAYNAKKRNLVTGHARDALLNMAAQKWVLAGDLNLDIARLQKREIFSDDDHQDVKSYNYISEKIEDLSITSGPTAAGSRRLDYIFGKNIEPVHAGVLKRQRIGDMDHDPVIIDFISNMNK